MSSHATPAPRLHEFSDRELESVVVTCERALLRGTSSHADLDALIAAERELLRRSGVRVRASAVDETHSSLLRSRTSEEDTLVL